MTNQLCIADFSIFGWDQIVVDGLFFLFFLFFYFFIFSFFYFLIFLFFHFFIFFFGKAELESEELEEKKNEDEASAPKK